jgi:hypothetical protein
VRLVVNSAPRQCECKGAFYGADVKVMLVDLEDDPDPRKYFDIGREVEYDHSKVWKVVDNKLVVDSKTPNEPKFRCAGDAKKDFEAVNDEIQKTLAAGNQFS